MSEFYAILTDVGAAKANAAALLGSSIKISEFGACDSVTAPLATLTALTNEVYRSDIADGDIVDNGTTVVVETHIKSDIDTLVYPTGFTVRNLGLYDTDGDLVVVAKVPPTYKYNLSGGAGVDLRTRIIFAIANADSVSLLIDPATSLATQKYINDKLDPFVNVVTGVDTEITGTHVDTFIYDTTNDSDGGAWRKRCQHLSWYTEDLNTATRGARREFPQVAIIVAEAAEITIYDGDYPDLPMWRVIDLTGLTVTALKAINGVLAVGVSIGLISQNYPADDLPISPNYTTASSPAIVNNKVNAVAVNYVLDAPIDPATGLQIPTIAVGTGAGCSIIHTDGSVTSISVNTSSWSSCNLIKFLNNGNKVPSRLTLASPPPSSPAAAIGTPAVSS